MPKGVVLYPNGTYEEKDFNGLKDMQDAVNGLIEIVHMYDYYGDEVLTGYVNEEGILLGLPLNTVASALSFMFGNNPMMLGNMIVLGKDDGEGNDTDIPQDITAFIKKVCADKNKIESWKLFAELVCLLTGIWLVFRFRSKLALFNKR